MVMMWSPATGWGASHNGKNQLFVGSKYVKFLFTGHMKEKCTV